jgi:hypothetical protein
MAPNDEFNYLMERLSKLATKAFVKHNEVRTVAVVSLHDADLLEKKEKAA